MSINVINSNGKVTAGHLKKTAYLYVRQSTLRQVFENTESIQRQYALRQRAVVLSHCAISSSWAVKAPKLRTALSALSSGTAT